MPKFCGKTRGHCLRILHGACYIDRAHARVKGEIYSAHAKRFKEYACVQDQLLQLMDGLPKLFNSTKGLSAAIYTQVSDVEAEVNGELAALV